MGGVPGQEVQRKDHQLFRYQGSVQCAAEDRRVARQFQACWKLSLARTDRYTNGTISGEWDRILLQRELERLIAEGIVEVIDCSPRPDTTFQETRCFRDTGTGDAYLYVDGWERGSPEFRKQT
jgi:hypothetical protein